MPNSSDSHLLRLPTDCIMNVIIMGANMKYLIFLTCLIFTIGSLSACAGATSFPTPTPSVQPLAPTLPLTTHGEQIVAHVNEQPITLIELERALERYPNIPNQEYDTYFKQELEKLIQQTLINQLAEAHQINVPSAEVDAEYQIMRQIMPDQAVWELWLKDNHFLNERDFWVMTRDTMTTARLQETIIPTLAERPITQLKARHILVSSQEQAFIAYNRLQTGGDFALIASQLSLDETTRAHGGDLNPDGGWFTPDELIVPELVQIVLNQAIGEYSQPIQTAFGWHIIQTLDRSTRPPTPEELAGMFQDWLHEQSKQAQIVRYVE